MKSSIRPWLVPRPVSFGSGFIYPIVLNNDANPPVATTDSAVQKVSVVHCREFMKFDGAANEPRFRVCAR